VVTGNQSPHRIPREQALPLTVGEIMIARPKTFRSDIKVGEVRQTFAQSSQRVVLLVDGSTFQGAIDRDALDPEAPDAAPGNCFSFVIRNARCSQADRRSGTKRRKIFVSIRSSGMPKPPKRRSPAPRTS
jgi:hypothetical protein